jgi:DNA-binding NarL/FixJ family response regulator
VSRPLRILVADDHELVRRGLCQTLRARPDWTVCGEAANGREAVALAEQCVPDIVIMDLTMPGLNGLEAARQIRRTLPETEILILTMHESEQLMHAVVRSGARGFVLKSDAGHVLLDAVDALGRHATYFTARLAEGLAGAFAESAAQGIGAPDALTPREREIVQLIAEGASTKDVAAALGISVKTVETHRTNLMRKLDIHSVSEIVRYAIRNRMVAP